MNSPQFACKAISPALVHAPPNFVEQMEIESITRFLPEILASLGTCCPWSRHRDTTVDHPAFLSGYPESNRDLRLGRLE